ncbi:MAG: hypothetical protein IPI00_08360 [Flavobacteriales bacterium]|nr:hypothetical protein [Flavobacteriales bacterium]MBK6943972.1 hypothetical protein [Flavobacteriales bacterium]MBK7240178.1 hypothetical protein [Flavobacteriales bacterium]MBK7297862.1 hypothetical protein [Flavobacteriales bacterium]MBK9533642.1 hypothetical protein [Flavobacteriales bacterium]
MNIVKRTLVSAVLFAAAVAFCSSIHANTFNGVPEGVNGTEAVVRIDLVNSSFMVSNDTATVLQRVVSAGTDGQYKAQVLAPDGTVMMEGSYSDVKCTVQNGPFTYYYNNGKVSAKGAYAMGIKTGIWLRFDAQGKALAERVYTGLNWEQTQIQLGLVSAADTKQ